MILVDMDGPLADFDRHFFDRCNAAGIRLDCTADQQHHRFATDHIQSRTWRQKARDMVNTSGWFAGLPVTPGAQEGMERLAAVVGIDNVWVCTKPLEANPTCRDEKADWLATHFGTKWLRQLIITPDKSMVRGLVLLDDAPNPAWFARATWRPVIYAAPWNGEGSKWEGLPRWTWDEPIDSLFMASNERTYVCE